MKSATTHRVAAATLASLALVGCVENRPVAPSANAKDGVLSVSSTADQCKVSANEVKSGNLTFEVRNEGDRTTEFYLLAADGLQIVAEKENIAPGASALLTITAQPGDYFTACKPGMRGTNIGRAAFKVTGEQVQLSGPDQELFNKAVGDYVSFAKNEVAELVPAAEAFAKAYIAGDDETARKLYAPTRVHYERIEPIAEALGVLDPRIDYREINYLAEADQLKKDDPTFTEWLGFHRMEKDLWEPAPGAVQPDGSPAHEGWKKSTPQDRARIGQAFITDINKLYEQLHAPDYAAKNNLTIATVSNGASNLLEEIAVNKVTGEEDWWSHSDLWDFQANLQGSRVAFDLVAPIAERKGPEGRALVAQIRSEFDKLQKLLDRYGSLDKGFVTYDKVSSAEQRELTAQVNATREPLSNLTKTVLGIK